MKTLLLITVATACVLSAAFSVKMIDQYVDNADVAAQCQTTGRFEYAGISYHCAPVMYEPTAQEKRDWSESYKKTLANN